MQFAVFSLVGAAPDAVTGESDDQQRRLTTLVQQAEVVEQLGYDAFGVGERHGAPFLSSAPPVLLAAIAARTSRIRLLTTVTVLSVLDPVRVAEDYATLDHLSEGRLDVVVGKGNDPRHFPLFGLDEARQWDYLEEKLELLKRLWSEEEVTWSGDHRASLSGITTQPRPFQQPIPIWHGSASSERSTDLAARHGDPLFSANAFHHLEKYARLVDHYRERWEAYGHDSADAVVGVGCGGVYLARTSQQAFAEFRPYFDAQRATAAAKHNASPFSSLEESAAGGTTLVGSPEQVIDRIGQFHDAFGHDVLGLGVDGFPLATQYRQLELFASEVSPVLRELFPERRWAEATPDLLGAGYAG